MAGADIDRNLNSLKRRSWYIDLAELLIGYALILAVIWTPGNLQRGLYWTTLVWIAVTAWRRRPSSSPSPATTTAPLAPSIARKGPVTLRAPS